MSKTVELARHLETLRINNMYKTDFYWTWDKTDDEIDAVFTVADALRDLRERNKSTKIFRSRHFPVPRQLHPYPLLVCFCLQLPGSGRAGSR